MNRLAAVGAIVLGLVLAVAGVAIGAVGLMAMGTASANDVVIFGAFILLLAAVGLIIWSVVALRRLRQTTGA